MHDPRGIRYEVSRSAPGDQIAFFRAIFGTDHEGQWHFAQSLVGYADHRGIEYAGCRDEDVVDRLTFGGTIIETGTHSYRLAQTRAKGRSDPATKGDS